MQPFAHGAVSFYDYTEDVLKPCVPQPQSKLIRLSATGHFCDHCVAASLRSERKLGVILL
jgi:hypothetical protein